MLPPLNLKAPKQITHVAHRNCPYIKIIILSNTWQIFFFFKGQDSENTIAIHIDMCLCETVFSHLFWFCFCNSIIIFLPSIIQAEEV